ncbi:enoyl-CoA hydratase family protein [Allosaccharopolyspora coralli]|uniref:Enoyl-CoA hydratase family protein n=1 Tax=Allosaccharopolyspora coralli TaxID=2665642 RepID=A0A5Q3Q7P3_9PSEU|nr:enoyl-CoA hydratase family protein [Allosaccharopolyspora coralli]QGK70502.1 enoyl-CoA hydratase family protein [Allosaccharopolyspora coralli]
MTDRFVHVEVADGVATLTLDSPHNRNALSAKLVAELRATLAETAEDSDVRAVLLTHSGTTFCAGADLTEAGDRAEASRPDEATHALIDLLRAIVALPKPVVGFLDGHVRAGGMGLVGACDVVVAGPSCTFALTEARLGLAPAVVSLTVLPRLTSRAANRYVLTGEKFGADEAARLGLVTVAAERPVEEVEAILRSLRLGSPQGLAESKALVSAPILADFDRCAEDLASRSARLFASEQAREGMMAFLEKRTPWWAR